MIELENVCVDIPVFTNEYAKSIRTTLAESVLGGRLSSSGSGRILVRALRGVSLSVAKGERIGLVGRNGAGKTTLLRTVAGIIPTSSGTVVVKGGVRSFFNLGAGLDLTRSGISNIEPMSLYYTRDRALIERAAKDIIAFADIGDFIHLPVYTYSAGMQARLLVAIATAYGGDILVFDEMLAAGDANFMAKIAKRLGELVGSANCMLLATHSSELMVHMCTRAIWLDEGLVRMDGPVDAVLAAYHEAA
jgi:lipopolysaccharide transport system ATP-binding protein